MGWVKTPKRTSEEIFADIIAERPTWSGRLGSSHCPYEYWADWIRDNYDVTLKQCDEICRMIKEHYKIDRFYYT